MTSYKNRTIDPYKPVRVYRNLHNGKFSVLQDGLVVAHMDQLCLADAKPHVNEAGRQRVIANKRKEFTPGSRAASTTSRGLRACLLSITTLTSESTSGLGQKDFRYIVSFGLAIYGCSIQLQQWRIKMKIQTELFERFARTRSSMLLIAAISTTRLAICFCFLSTRCPCLPWSNARSSKNTHTVAMFYQYWRIR